MASKSKNPPSLREQVREAVGHPSLTPEEKAQKQQSQDAMKVLEKWRKDPIAFIKFCWPDSIVWPKLEEIARAIPVHDRIVVRSGHGVGKSWLMARLAIWWLSVYDHSKVLTTAPTWTQVEKILWAEIRTAYQTSAVELGGHLLQTEWKISDDRFAIGIATAEQSQNRQFGATRMQGYHAPNLLVLLDEGAGVAEEIWTGALSLLTGENNRLLAIGNPTSPEGPFFDAFQQGGWHKIRVSCLEHPNNIENMDVIPGAVTRKWIAERREEWGETSVLYKAKILGEFPDEADDTLIPLSVVQAAVGRVFPPELDEKGVPKVKEKKPTMWAVDVARYGDDETVIYRREDKTFFQDLIANKQSTTQTAGWLTGKWKACDTRGTVFTDDGGVGGGVTDILRENGVTTCGINFGGKADNPEKFYNKKAEMYWNMRIGFMQSDVSIPNDDILVSQIASIRYFYTKTGQIAIESKDDMKRRGLKSPDRADALAIAFCANPNMGVEWMKTKSPMMTAGLLTKKF